MPEMITLHVHQHTLDQACPAGCPHAGTVDAIEVIPAEEQPTRDEIRKAISDAYYDTRNAGGTMETAADAAAAAVLELMHR